MAPKNTFSRRTFLKTTAAIAAPMILPSGVLARPGRPGANDRVILGMIGVGGQGRGHVNAFNNLKASRIAAVCDVDEKHRNMAAEIVEDHRVDQYNDFREILDRQDIDAVVISAPDHWHGVMAVLACEAGKDVYCEKPNSKTIAEGQAMLKAARRYGRVVQIGSQGRSTEGGHATANYVRNGQIGKVNRVVCWHENNWTPGGDPTKFSDPPPGFDWDMWLGPARWMPYNPDYVHFNFRWMMEFGAGFIRDRGAHVLSVVQWALDLDRTYPRRISAGGNPPTEGLWDVPPTFWARFEYDDPELVITWDQPGEAAADHKFGATFHGDKDTLIMRGGDGGCYAEDKALAYEPPGDGVHLYKSPGHQENWLDCLKTRQKPIMDIEDGHRVATVCNLAEIAYRVGRTLEFDPVTETVIGDEQANRMLYKPGRGQWQV